MGNPALFRDLLAAVAVGCNMKIDFDDNCEYIEFSTDMGLQFYLIWTEESSAVTLAIPLDSLATEAIRSMALSVAILNFSDVLTEHGKVGVLPDASALIYLSKWRDYYGVEQDRICVWLSSCLAEADICRDALTDLQHIWHGEVPQGT